MYVLGVYLGTQVIFVYKYLFYNWPLLIERINKQIIEIS